MVQCVLQCEHQSSIVAKQHTANVPSSSWAENVILVSVAIIIITTITIIIIIIVIDIVIVIDITYC